MSRNLIARLAVAVVAIPIILWLIYQSGIWLFSLVLLLAVLAKLEFLAAENWRPSDPIFWLSLVLVPLILCGVLLGTLTAGQFGSVNAEVARIVASLVVGFFLITGILLAIRKDDPAELFVRYAHLVWGMVYIGPLYAIVFLLGIADQILEPISCSGGDLLLFLFAVLWISDSMAMWVGKAFGRRQLAPTVSPNKTVAGFVGGLAGGLIVAAVVAFWKLSSIPLIHVLAMGLGTSLFGQLGDLVESMWKRSLGIKDSSRLIPGHGGILDRFDSLLFAAPFLYAYLHLVYR